MNGGVPPGSHDGPGLPCPLCGHGDTADYCTDRWRSYRRCPACHLVFVPPRFHLSAVAEKAEYDRHQNDPTDAGYRRFLGRLVDPLQELLAPASQGLDFGAGPGPTVSMMLEEAGHQVALYDPFYHPDRSVFDHSYDFVTATEVVEHLRHPRAELDQLWTRVRPGGVLGIMTKLVRDRDAFAGWHYKRDPTHVCFFARESFQYLARQWRAELIFLAADALVLRKSADTRPAARSDGATPE